MNILIIGNGFDLAHGLPTKYTDFLDWIIAEFRYWEYSKKRGDGLPNMVNKLPLELNIPPDKKQKKTIFTPINKQIELWDCINNNFWIEYFLQCDMHNNENWIDFEKEISNIIQSLDNDMNKDSNNLGLDEKINDLSNEYLNKYYYDCTFLCRQIDPSDHILYPSITYRNIRDRLCEDLDKTIRAFEIYLIEYVEKIDIQFFSSDIVNSFLMSCKKDDNNKDNENKILNFNYTNTFERIYLHKYGFCCNDEDIDYIHGKADIDNSIESNNMVLGIDEYLPFERRNTDIDFIAFKKYYQRIHKGTGCKYKEWVNKMQEDYYNYISEKILSSFEDMQTLENRLASQAIIDESCKKHYLYIFGHSLDVTDKDILRDLILNNNVYTTVFYVNKEVMGRQIANLVKVIGQDELIRRTGGNTKTIEFRIQNPMIERENSYLIHNLLNKNKII